MQNGASGILFQPDKLRFETFVNVCSGHLLLHLLEG